MVKIIEESNNIFEGDDDENYDDELMTPNPMASPHGSFSNVGGVPKSPKNAIFGTGRGIIDPFQIRDAKKFKKLHIRIQNLERLTA
jgi:hypothetical protein